MTDATFGSYAIPSNRYNILERIGKGGMGEVHRALDRLSGEFIALKSVRVSPTFLLFASKTDHDDNLVALANEFATLASLRHPNIISVLDYGFDTEKRPFYTMELLANPQTIVEASEDLDDTDRIQLIIQVLQALTYLHRRGVVHRDLKPGNILVVDGHVYVLDFGLAAAREAAEGAAGTLSYMAPEVISQKRASPLSDLYSLGVVAYRMFAGHLPYELEDIMNLFRQAPDLSAIEDPALAAVIGRLLSKFPEDRYRHAEHTIEAFCRAVDLPVPSDNSVIRDSFLQSAKFIGREAELEQLMDSFKNASNRRGALWFVTGESGVGKTRLLDELRIRTLVRGAQVVKGQAIRDGGLPFQLWRDAVRRMVITTPLSDKEASILKAIVPDIGRLLDRDIEDAPTIRSTSALQRLVLTIVELFKRQGQPVVLLLEDLQWTDESIIIIQQLNRIIEEIPLLIVGTYRSDEASTIVKSLPQGKMLHLGRLQNDEIAELSQSMLGETGAHEEVLDLLKRETEGNAFFLVEVVRALAEDVGRLSDIGRLTLPEHMMVGGIQNVVKRRIEQVPDWAKPLLQLSAVVGRELDLNVLDKLTANIEPIDMRRWLSVCNDAAVIEIKDEKWRFSHDKVREFLIEEIEDSVLANMHQAVAIAFQSVHGDDDAYAATLAEHWHKAGNTLAAVKYTIKACDVLQRIGNYTELIRLGERALIQLNEITNIEEVEQYRLRLLLELAETYERISEFKKSQDYFTQGLTFAQHLKDEISIAIAHNGISAMSWRRGNLHEAEEAAQSALTISRELNLRYEESKALGSLAVLSQLRGNGIQALDYNIRSLKIREDIQDQHGIANVLNNLGIMSDMGGNHKQAINYFERSLASHQELGEKHGEARILNNLGNAYQQLQELDKARDYYNDSLAIRRQVGDRKGVSMSLNNLGSVEMRLKNYGNAKSYFIQSIDLKREISDRIGESTIYDNLGNLARLMGNYPEALEWFEMGYQLSIEISSFKNAGRNLTGQGLVAYDQRNYITAVENFKQAFDLAVEHNDTTGIILNQSYLVSAYLRQHHLDRALEMLLEALDLGMQTHSPSLHITIISVGIEYAANTAPQPAIARWAGLVLSHYTSTEDSIHLVKQILPVLRVLVGENTDEYMKEGELLTIPDVLSELEKLIKQD